MARCAARCSPRAGCCAAIPGAAAATIRCRRARRALPQPPIGRAWTSSNAISSSPSRCRWRSCLGFQFFFARRARRRSRPEAAARPSTAAAPRRRRCPPRRACGARRPPMPHRASQVLAEAPRVNIATPRLNGSIDLAGARLDDLTLVNYHETTDPNSPEIALLAPDGTEHALFRPARLGPGRRQGQGAGTGHALDQRGRHARARPSAGAALGQRRGADLRAALRGRSPSTCSRVTETVENHGADAGDALSLRARVARGRGAGLVDLPAACGADRRVQRHARGRDQVCRSSNRAASTNFTSTGGWMGFTDKYWLVALIPDSRTAVKARMRYTERDKTDVYQVDYTGAEHVAPPGGSSQRRRTALRRRQGSGISSTSTSRRRACRASTAPSISAGSIS